MGLSTKNANGQGGYATVWKIVNDKDTYLTAQVSTSYKKKDGSGYVTDFQDGFVYFMFNAYEKLKAATIPEHGGLRIQITSLDVTSKYNQEKGAISHMFKIFDFDIPEAYGQSAPAATEKPAPKTAKKKEPEQTEEEQDDLPF